MEITLLAHTQLSDKFRKKLAKYRNVKDSEILSLTAIRTCYSHLKPTEIVEVEGGKYFGEIAKDGEGGTESDRLIRHIVRSGHTSTLEHDNYTFAVEGVSRVLLGQITRHRMYSFSVQSMRYVKFGSEDKSQGMSFVVPDGLEGEALETFLDAMDQSQVAYDKLRELGVSAEKARMALPLSASCNFVMTGNLRGILDFYSKRRKGTHAQDEIQELAELIRKEVEEASPWTTKFFDEI